MGGYGAPIAPAAPADPWQQVLTRLRVATLGEFEIVREVGRGGMAAVYLAKDMTLGRKVAIKVMAPALLAGEGMVERFKNEAITVASLSHPNIISAYAVRQSGDLQFFVMKFVEGKQCYARPVTAASDQYSLGVVAYEMLTGRVPFEGSPFTVMQAHTEKPVPLLETFKRAGSNFRAAQLKVSAPEIGWTEATANFTVRASWKPATGAVKNQTLNFRATLERSGNGWKLLGVRALDKLE